MLTQDFDRETEKYLADILAKEQTTTTELMRQLIRDRWLSLHAEAPLDSAKEANAFRPAKHKNSKQLIAEFMKKKNHRAVH